MYLYKEKSLPENADLRALMFAEQISRDYIEIIRTEVVPEIFEKYKIKLREIRVLMCLGCSTEKYMSASEVTGSLRQDRATIARSSIILIGEKFVYTTPNMDDSRVKNLYLTPKGTQVAAECIDLFERRLKDIQALGELEGAFIEEEETTSILKTLEKRARLILHLSKRIKKSRS